MGRGFQKAGSLFVAGWGAVAWASAAEPGGIGQKLIQPQFGTVFWTLVTFVVLAFLLGKFAWKPLLQAVEERERAIRTDLEEARQERERARALLEEQKSLLEQARRERAAALEQGRLDAERLKAEILEEARRQREELLRQGEAQLEAAVRRARAELRGAAADLAIQVAAKLLADNLDEEAQRKLVEDYLSELERMPAGSATPPG
jgi:F-type H+-transporting ATPase subunit b